MPFLMEEFRKKHLEVRKTETYEYETHHKSEF